MMQHAVPLQICWVPGCRARAHWRHIFLDSLADLPALILGWWDSGSSTAGSAGALLPLAEPARLRAFENPACFFDELE